jgi:hypothetical protein
MSERLTCPYCENSIDVDMVEMAGLWRERSELAARLGSAFRLCNEYLDSFRAAPDGRLSLKRRVRHLMALAHLWETEEFEFKGKRYRVNRAIIKDALTKVCEAGKFGFSDHNYLKVIMVKSSERVSSEGLTAREEKKREEGRRLKAEERAALAPEPDKEEFKRKIGEIVNNIGRAMP